MNEAVALRVAKASAAALTTLAGAWWLRHITSHAVRVWRPGGGRFLHTGRLVARVVGSVRAMIPHHSIAILTSERAKITDPRVRKLADQIIEAQRKEIGEMKALIDELEKSGG